MTFPSTNIVTTQSSTVDFSGLGPVNTLGGLTLGGTVTVQDVAGGGSVQFGGDLVATTNAALIPAAGAGSSPSLVLAGTGNNQNIKAAAGYTLTLPAMAISATSVTVGNPQRP